MSARGFALATALAVLGPVATLAAQQAGFGRVLWLPAEAVADPARLQRVRAAGFTGINLGPGLDPAPARSAGLSFYLDQPIGKGFLELRDREFEPIQQAYERDRDPRALVRPQCFDDQRLLADLGARAAAAASAVGKDRLLFVALADEASATRHNNPLDLCRCAGSLAAFRAFARQRHATIEAVNNAWSTSFASFDQLEPLTTDQVRRRELGGVLLPQNLRPYAEWLEFVDQEFAAAVTHLREQVQRELPGVPVGLTGLQPPSAFGGHDYAQLLRGQTLIEPYDLGAAPRLCRSLLPQADQWFTLPLPVADDPAFANVAMARLAEAAALGSAGVVVWNEAAMFGADGAIKPAGVALQQAFARLQPVLDACAGGVPQAASVWIVESPASVRTWWMLDSAPDGLTWVRRKASYEAEHSTSLAARRGFALLLADLGITPQYVDERDLPERLLQQRPRLLVLPAVIALADRACRAIAAYAQQGGTVLADHSTALYDETLMLRTTGGLDELFGITERSLRWADQAVAQGRASDPATLVAATGMKAQLAERSGDGIVFVERRPGRGRAVALQLSVCDYPRVRLEPATVALALDLRRRVRQVLQTAEVEPVCDVRGDGLPTCIERTVLRIRDGRTVLAVRVNALDAPVLLRNLAGEGRRSIRLEFARPVQLLELTGRDLGRKAAFDLQLDVHAGLFVELRR